MATKDELMTENATLKQRVRELEEIVANAGEETDGEGVALEDGAIYRYEELFDGSFGFVRWEPIGVRVRGADGTYAVPEEGAVYRYDGTNDLVRVDVPPLLVLDAEDGSVTQVDDRVLMLQHDLLAMQVQRDEARGEAARLKDRLKGAGALHGSIDALPPVV